jgi:trk system potassium uptake protein TrkA
VPKVVARLYDPPGRNLWTAGLLTIFHHLGAAYQRPAHHADLNQPVFGSGNFATEHRTAQPACRGAGKDLSIPGEIQVAAITRRGNAFIPLGGTELQAGDILHLSVLASAVDRLQDLLGFSQGA